MQNWHLLSSSKLNIALHQQKSAQPISAYNPHRGIINHAVFNHTNKVIASCGQDSRLQLRSPAQEQKLLDLTFHTDSQQPTSINCLQFSNKSKYIAAGAASGIIKVWDMKLYKQPYRKLKGHNGAVTSLTWINSQDIVASASTSGEVNLYRVATGAIIDSLSVSKSVRDVRNAEGYNNIKVSEGEGFSRLAACTVSGSIFIWDLNMVTKKPIFTYQDPEKYQTTCISISPFRPALLASSSLNSSLTFLDIQQKKTIRTVSCQQPLTCVTFHNNGHTIAVGGCNGGLWVYDLRKLNQYISKYNGHETAMKSVYFASSLTAAIGSSNTQKDNNKQSRSSNKYTQAKIKQPISNTNISHNKSNPNSQTAIVQQKQSKLRNLSNNNYIAPSSSVNKNIVNDNNTAKDRDVGSHTVVGVQKQQKSQTNSRVTKYRGGKQQYPQKQQIQATTIPNPISLVTNTTQNKHLRNHPAPPTHQLNSAPISMSNTTTAYTSLEQKLLSKQSQLREQIHDRFDALHLQIIRQMELNMKTMITKMDEINHRNRELQQKIHTLQNENQQLRKRTY